MSDKETLETIYPLTIIRDRYNGTYSKGQYLAFNVDYYEIPEEIGGSDTDEMNFWNIEESSHLVGKGQTITEAEADLLIKLNEDKL